MAISTSTNPLARGFTWLFTTTLRAWAQSVLWRYRRQVKVIGVSGSVGKTTTRTLLAAALRTQASVYTPPSSYNNDFGFPLAVLLVKQTPGSSPLAWIKLKFHWLGLLIGLIRYPNFLALEYGIDRPGDMPKLIQVVVPDLLITTRIGVSHIGNYDSHEQIIAEEFLLIDTVLQRGGQVILNADDAVLATHAAHCRQEYPHQVSTYSAQPNTTADFQCQSITEDFDHLQQKVTIMHAASPGTELVLPRLGYPVALSATAVVAAITKLSLNPAAILPAVLNSQSYPAERLQIHRLGQRVIIDDTYNASPESMRAALDLLARWPAPSRVAVLGSMKELGSLEHSAHSDLGKYVAGLSVDVLITVDFVSAHIAESAKVHGFAGQILSYDSVHDFLAHLRSLPDHGVILFKASHSVQLNQAVRQLLAITL